ncbi:hypothetical protein DXG01_005815, partial [Tephrocybe rancida]
VTQIASRSRLDVSGHQEYQPETSGPNHLGSHDDNMSNLAHHRWQALPSELVYDIVAQCNLRDQGSCRQVSRELHAVVQHILHSALGNVFRQGNLSFDHMRAVLRSTGALSSGSAALLMLNPPNFSPGDLDLYVGPASATELLTFLKEHYPIQDVTPPSPRAVAAASEALSIIPPYLINVMPADSDYVDLTGIQAVRILCNGAKKINVMIGKWTALSPIFYFHSTVVMNYISADEVYCAYPDLTMSMRNIINSHVVPLSEGPVRTRAMHCIQKYEDCQYKSSLLLSWPEHSSHICGDDFNCPFTQRRLTDHGGFKLPLAAALQEALPLMPSNLLDWPNGGHYITWDLQQKE